MPLNTPKLTTDLKDAFLKLETTLQADLFSHLSNATLGNMSLYEVQKKIDDWIAANPAKSGFDITAYKKQVWTEVSKEWATSLSTHLAKDISKNMSVVLAPLIATIIDAHLQTASIYITIPPGVVTVGAGPAAAPNPVPIPLTFDPLSPLTNGGIK